VSAEQLAVEATLADERATRAHAAVHTLSMMLDAAPRTAAP